MGIPDKSVSVVFWIIHILLISPKIMEGGIGGKFVSPVLKSTLNVTWRLVYYYVEAGVNAK